MAANNYITQTELSGVLIMERPTHADPRGFFRETFRKQDLEDALGRPVEFVQANHSRSQTQALRGVHIAPWDKLVTVSRGQVQQVVVDTRPDSSTFGQHISIILGEDNWRSVFIPAGCGNAFLVLSDIADYNYLTGDYWSPNREISVIYNDTDLNIAWQTRQPLISEKDQQNKTLRELFPQKFP
jgi:dTDP-4-dehydrorhamnose 3,5-epimerase